MLVAFLFLLSHWWSGLYPSLFFTVEMFELVRALQLKFDTWKKKDVIMMGWDSKGLWNFFVSGSEYVYGYSCLLGIFYSVCVCVCIYILGRC